MVVEVETIDLVWQLKVNRYIQISSRYSQAKPVLPSRADVKCRTLSLFGAGSKTIVGGLKGDQKIMKER